MHNTKMVNSLSHWVLFELICTVGGIFYLFNVISKLNMEFEWWVMVAILLLVVRIILLLKLWLYSLNPTAGVDTTDDSVPVQSETDTPKSVNPMEPFV